MRLGQAWNEAPGAARPTLRLGLPVRRGLSATSRRSRPVMPAANAEAMSLHRTAIGRKVATGSHAALSSMAPAIILLPRSRSPKTSPLSVCHPTLPNSIRSKTSGNICAATNSPSPSSTTTTTSSIKLCGAWNFFEQDPNRIASITTRTWATVND